jgi:uncharacterized SAM-binding protein YcdF (DUF218 family)
MGTAIPEEHRADFETLWDFLQLHHELRPADVGIGLGSHDPTVPELAVDLFNRQMFPYIVFTGANAPTTIKRYPRGEAVHYGEYAVEHGVPAELVILETRARTTPENIAFTRELLAAQGRTPTSAVIMSRPYQQRRAYSIARRLWPGLDAICASVELPVGEYVQTIGDVDRVVNMMVGDLQRLDLDYRSGAAIESPIPAHVNLAYSRLVAAGYTQRLVPADQVAES